MRVASRNAGPPTPTGHGPGQVWAPPGTLPNLAFFASRPRPRASRCETRYPSGMQALKAHVRSGRIVVDDPTDLPEGAELEVGSLQVVDAGDDLDDEERER